MSVWGVLGYVLLAAFLGVVGQLIRVVAGLKKESDQASALGQTLATRFNAPQLWTSLGISLAVGAIAGTLAALQITDWQKVATPTLLGFLGAGYSGTDFIEAFMKKSLPGQ